MVDASIDVIFEIFDSTNTVVASFDAADLDDGEERIYCAQDDDFTIKISENTGTYFIDDEDIDPYLERSDTGVEADPYDLESSAYILYDHRDDTTQSGMLTLQYELYDVDQQKYCRDGEVSLPITLPLLSCTNATSTGGVAECGTYTNGCVELLDCGVCTGQDECVDGTCVCQPLTTNNCSTL